MRTRLLVAWGPLLFLCGCVENLNKQLIGKEASTPTPVIRPQPVVSQSPTTESAARRVIEMGQKLVLANPQMGMRPMFLTVGSPQPEVFHKGGMLDGYTVFVSEGLVKQCSEEQLAGILSLELGKIVSERESMSTPTARQGSDRPPPSESIGSDAGGTFGPPDGTRMMELAKYDRQRKQKRLPPPPPETLARNYLKQAGYEVQALESSAPLLRKAEDNYKVERQLGQTRVR